MTGIEQGWTNDHEYEWIQFHDPDGKMIRCTRCGSAAAPGRDWEAFLRKHRECQPHAGIGFSVARESALAVMANYERAKEADPVVPSEPESSERASDRQDTRDAIRLIIGQFTNTT